MTIVTTSARGVAAVLIIIGELWSRRARTRASASAA
nr:hypothetical protein [Frigoribacterium sp. PvP032]